MSKREPTRCEWCGAEGGPVARVEMDGVWSPYLCLVCQDAAFAEAADAAAAQRRAAGRPPGKKKVRVSLIQRRREGQEEDAWPYRILDELIAAHHDHLAEAAIGLAFNYGWGPDADGRLRLGQAQKATDLQKEFHCLDFIISLNGEVWNAAGFSEDHMRALLDHELCHCQVAVDDDTGEPKTDERGRLVYRTRKHDVEEFTEIVARRGLWRRDLEAFAKAALDRQGQPLLQALDV